MWFAGLELANTKVDPEDVEIKVLTYYFWQKLRNNIFYNNIYKKIDVFFAGFLSNFTMTEICTPMC